MEKAEKITDGYREAVKNASAALEEINTLTIAVTDAPTR